MEQEVFTPVIDFENYYEVSNIGRVKSLAREWVTGERWGVRTKEVTILRFGERKASNGIYYFVVLCANGVKKYATVHRLVAQHFCPNPNGYNVVNHKNSITTDNRAENLEWTTTKGNVQHSFKYGNRILPTGENSFNGKLKEKDVIEIRKLYSIGGLSLREIGDMYGVWKTTVHKIVNNIIWKQV